MAEISQSQQQQEQQPWGRQGPEVGDHIDFFDADGASEVWVRTKNYLALVGVTLSVAVIMFCHFGS